MTGKYVWHGAVTFTGASSASCSFGPATSVRSANRDRRLIQPGDELLEAQRGVLGVLERQRGAHPRHAQSAREVADARIPRLQLVEQLGRDLVAAAPLQHAELVRIHELARARIEHERLGEPLVRDEVAGGPGD